VNKKRDTLKK